MVEDWIRKEIENIENDLKNKGIVKKGLRLGTKSFLEDFLSHYTIEGKKEGTKGRLILKERLPYYFLLFPTGYGKTVTSIALALLMNKYYFSNFDRLIHVAPTKTLIDDIFDTAKNAGIKGGIQYELASREFKDPYFISDFVVTTYDSFSLNLYKAVISEPKSEYGHYELPRGAIFSSLIHFDEYHLLWFSNDSYEHEERTEYNRGWTTFYTSVEQLVKKNVPIIFSTATPSKIMLDELKETLESLGNEVKIFKVVDVNDNSSYTANDKNYTIIKDYLYKPLIKQVLKKQSSESDNELVEVLEEALNEWKSYGYTRKPKVAIVTNTVSKAIETYKIIKESPNFKDYKNDVYLLHSMMTKEDRKCIENRVEGSNGYILVATPVIEVGVNYLDADIMITELSELPSLVQRVGRLIRNPRDGKEPPKYEGLLYIIDTGNYGPYNESNVNELSEKLCKEDKDKCEVSINLKYPGENGYGKLVDEIYNKNVVKVDTKLRYMLRTLDENPLLSKPDLRRVLDEYCSLIREGTLVTVTVCRSNDNEKMSFEYIVNESFTIRANTLFKLYDLCKNDKIEGIFMVTNKYRNMEFQVKGSSLLKRALCKDNKQRSENELCSRLSQFIEYESGESYELFSLCISENVYKKLWGE